MFGGLDIHTVIWNSSYDPAADKTYRMFRAPGPLEIKRVAANVPTAVGASTADYFTLALQNGGTAGTATTAVAAAIGGTPGWAANTPQVFTISEGTMAEGETLNLVYDETGTATFGMLTVQIDYVQGIAAA